MNTMVLELNDALRSERITDVASFVGTDASGCFGILPGRSRFMTILGYGLARFRKSDGAWQYLACPGAVLRFADNRLSISTRRYLRDSDHERIAAMLSGQLAKEEEALKSIKENLEKLEQELFRRLRNLERSP